ncbi:MAG TPA: hypothetical protein DHV92_09425 [Ruminococcaceae bacterium]|nr:hypothetical protein [Oscillospiraceae bacterium]
MPDKIMKKNPVLSLQDGVFYVIIYKNSFARAHGFGYFALLSNFCRARDIYFIRRILPDKKRKLCDLRGHPFIHSDDKNVFCKEEM